MGEVTAEHVSRAAVEHAERTSALWAARRLRKRAQQVYDEVLSFEALAELTEAALVETHAHVSLVRSERQLHALASAWALAERDREEVQDG